ncbi:cytochrome P450 [Streptomyces sp. NPDC047042]|uniref:cytochrome P450 n=1 Tax=Streptomyces sp. NPDC047042 TaxID=3154807 RepID=UPI0033FB0AFC
MDYPFSGAHDTTLEPQYATARATGRLTKVTMPVGGEAWLATTHDQVRQILSDSRFSRRLANGPQTPRLTPDLLPEGSLLAVDPPEHSRLRRQISRCFMPRQVVRFGPRIEALVEGLLDALEADPQPVDLVRRFAQPLPDLTTAAVLGIPTADHGEFFGLADAVMGRVQAGPGVPEPRAELAAYLRRLTSDGPEPGTTLAGTSVSDSDELVDLVIALVAGGRTSTTFLSSAVFALLHEPDASAQLRERPELMPDAVEELLRYVPVGLSGGFPRTLTEDAECGGQQFRAGETVLPATISANFDESVFSDPQRLDLTRRPNPHLAFGHGSHHCVGAPLARIQMNTALAGLLSRFPGLRLAENVPPVWHSGLVVRALSTLHVQW